MKESVGCVLQAASAQGLSVAGNTAVTVLSGGNVGIGTTNPGTELHVVSRESSVGYDAGRVSKNGIVIDTGMSAGDGGWGFHGINFFGDADDFSFIHSIHNNSAETELAIGTNSAEQMRINEDGNVGIGTAQPVSNLHINGGVSGSVTLLSRLDHTGSTTGSGPGIQFVLNGDTEVGRIYAQSTNGKTSSFLSLGSQGGANSIVLNNGNVGIGTTNPTEVLYVSGNIYATGTLSGGSNAAWTLNGSNAYYDNGNVGIGTTNPDEKLEVAVASGSQADIQLTSGSNGMKFGAQDSGSGRSAISNINNGGGAANIFSLGFGDITAGVPALPVFSMNQNGNVGIGTTNPEGLFEVIGDVPTYNLTFDGSTGFLGIGTPTPTALLELQSNGIWDTGLISIKGQDGDRAVILGDSASSGWVETGVLGLYANNTLNVYLRGSDGGNSYFNTGGNVGIGTTNPGYQLDVNSGGGNDGIHVSTSGADSGAYFGSTGGSEFTIAGGANYSAYNGGAYQYTAKSTAASGIMAENGKFSIWSDTGLTAGNNFTPSKRISITSAGNVGIGTTAPGAITHISSTAAQDLFRVDDTAGDTTPFLINRNGQLGIGTENISAVNLHIVNTNYFPQILIDSGNNSGAAIDLNSTKEGGPKWRITALGPDIGGERAGNFEIQGQGDNQSAGLAFVITTDNGKVGIKQTAPVGNLHVSTNSLVVLENGNVGIGTTNPVTSLHVDLGTGTLPAMGSSTGLLVQRNATTAQNADVDIIAGSEGISAVYFGDNGAAGRGRVAYNHNGDFLTFGTAGGTDKAVIDAAGNVGIGTTNPLGTLEIREDENNTFLKLSSVAGLGQDDYMDISFYDTTIETGKIRFLVNNAGAGEEGMSFWTYDSPDFTEKLRINGNGNVGIGTTNPGYDLVVNGDFSLSETYTKVVGDALVQAAGSSEIALNLMGGIGVPEASPPDTVGTKFFQIGGQHHNGFVSPVDHNAGSIALEVGSTGPGERYSTDLVFRTLEDSFDDNIATTSMVMKGNGNVGIGTTNPAEEMDVVGSIKASQAIYMRRGTTASLTASTGTEVIATDMLSHSWYMVTATGQSNTNIYGCYLIRTDGNADVYGTSLFSSGITFDGTGVDGELRLNNTSGTTQTYKWHIQSYGRNAGF